MNKKAVFFILIFILLQVVVAVSPASAAAPQSGCQPGPENHRIGDWQELTEDEYAVLLFETLGEPYPGAAKDAAAATYAFCDHNGDGKACVQTYTFPFTFNIVDNHLYGGK